MTTRTKKSAAYAAILLFPLFTLTGCDDNNLKNEVENIGDEIRNVGEEVIDEIGG